RHPHGATRPCRPCRNSNWHSHCRNRGTVLPRHPAAPALDCKPMTAAIEASGITVRIGAKALIDDVALAIEPGETVALVGPNGAGKSTLLRVLAGEIAPRTGTVALRGRALQSYPPQALALHRAVLSQHTTVAFPFTVADVVRMGAGSARGGKADALVAAALAEGGLAGFEERII